MERERVNNELGGLSRVLIKSNPPKAYAYARYASARRLVGQLKKRVVDADPRGLVSKVIFFLSVNGGAAFLRL